MKRLVLEHCNCPIQYWSDRIPDQCALTGEIAMTWQALDRYIEQAVNKGREAGVGFGDVVVTEEQGQLQMIIGLWACFRLGAVWAPLNPRWSTSIRSDYMLNLQPKWFWRHEKFNICNINGRQLKWSGTAVATSGSTGQPKAILHSFEQQFLAAKASQAELPISTDSSWLASLPLYHIGGIQVLIRCAWFGASIVTTTKSTEACLIAPQYTFTHVSVVPTQLRTWFDCSESMAQAAKLDAILVGGAPLPADLRDQLNQLAWPIAVTYGSTEACSQISTGWLNAGPNIAHSGQPLGHVEVRCQTGEVSISGCSVARWLLKGGELIAIEQPFLTGDLGHYHNGWLVLTGRKDNRFISGGENVQIEEVEQMVSKWDGVERVVVIALPHFKWGMRPHALIAGDPSMMSYWQQANRQLAALYRLETIHIMPAKLFSGMKISRKAAQTELKRLMKDNGMGC